MSIKIYNITQDYIWKFTKNMSKYVWKITKNALQNIWIFASLVVTIWNYEVFVKLRKGKNLSRKMKNLEFLVVKN